MSKIKKVIDAKLHIIFSPESTTEVLDRDAVIGKIAEIQARVDIRVTENATDIIEQIQLEGFLVEIDLVVFKDK